VAFIGQRPPEGSRYSASSWFWGDPILQSIKQAVANADTASDGFSGLIDEAKIDIIKIPGLVSQAATPEYEERMTRRLAAAAQGKSTWRALMIDADEEWDQRQITWAGMPEMIFATLQVVCGAADTPITRLLGTSPKGMQSDGGGEERDYQTMVSAKQRVELAPNIEIIDELLIRSALGSRPSDVYYEFAPLKQMDEKDAADIEAKRASTIKTYADTGMLQEGALSTIAKNSIIESGRWPGSEAAFEAAANDPLPGEQDPNQLTTLEQRVAAMEGKGTIQPADAARLLTDAQPRSLYVSRKLLNADAVIAWAKKQGFDTTLAAADMHVTVLFSRASVDWMKMGSGWDDGQDGKLKIAPGGARMIEKFDGGAVVLLFSSSSLSWRHEDMVRQGASHDFDEYAPHVTITYEARADLDLAKIEPYRGELIFGPEIFEEINEDWKQSVTEQ
jgi:hypothetical protein